LFEGWQRARYAEKRGQGKNTGEKIGQNLTSGPLRRNPPNSRAYSCIKARFLPLSPEMALFHAPRMLLEYRGNSIVSGFEKILPTASV
jgi:hypothetical protein